MTGDEYNSHVSDHAIIRFLERKYGMDIEGIKKEILPDHIKKQFKQGLKKYTIGGMEFIISNGVVVTCVPTSCQNPELRPSKTKQHMSNKKSKDDNWHQRKKYTKRLKKKKW